MDGSETEGTLMRFGPRRVLRRAFALSSLSLWIFLAAPGAARAEVTIRIEPEVVVFPSSGVRNAAFLTIYLDNVPAPGVRVVDMFLDARPHDPEGPKCVWFDSATVDPGLKATWGGAAFSYVHTLADQTQVEWLLRAPTYSPAGATGTVRLGTLRFLASVQLDPRCILTMQRNFEWVPGSVEWGTLSAPNLPVPVNLGAAWVIGSAPDVDLTLSCALTSPADPARFVDGDVAQIDCQVSNYGTADAQLPAAMTVVLSDDLAVDGGDTEIVHGQGAGILAAGSSRQITLSAQPIVRTPGPLNICTKVDADEANLDNVRGILLETDETNNSQCWPINVIPPHRDLVVAPASVSLSPDPQSPGGLFRAGLPLQVAYDAFNQGNGAVRASHRQIVRLGSTLQAALADPNAILCGVNVDMSITPPLAGGSSLHESFGLGTGTSNEICKIPFTKPPGSYVLVVQLDSNNDVVETDPNGDSTPAESNNAIAVPITVDLPLDPQFRVQHKSNDASDQTVEIFGPNNGTMYVAAASVRSLTAYSLRLSWSPANLMYAGTPGGPGDPNRVVFTNFLTSRGLAQSCAVTSIDPNAGHLDVACTTSNPGGGLPATSETSVALFGVTFTPDLPGGGPLTVTDFTAEDGAGQPFTALRVSNGTFTIGGAPDLYVDEPVPPAVTYPGVPFTASWRLRNVGFGAKPPPLITDLVLSLDDVLDRADPVLPDDQICDVAETVAFAGRTEGYRTATDCVIEENYRPGLYTGFYEVHLVADPNR
ncbi:MAG TPA: hypothetical protein VNI57_15785, partial [Candidatus Saccharimonadales bacterium]|nr:hypothetical protein [Candidatus Saccharimonadales bacterium]